MRKGRKILAYALTAVLTAGMLVHVPGNVRMAEAAPSSLAATGITVTGGSEGTDYVFNAEENRIEVKTGTALTFTSGTFVTTGTQIYVNPNVDANLILNGLKVNMQSIAASLGVNTPSPIKIADDSNGTVNLTVNGENTLTGYYNPAIQKNGGQGRLIIQGTGTLNAFIRLTSIDDYTMGGAAIGSSAEQKVTGIEITGATVNAYNQYDSKSSKYHGSGGAAIGSGCKGDVGSILISGGSITAIADTGEKGADNQTGGAAIGSGCGTVNNSAEKIQITGGTVIASTGKNSGAAIGGMNVKELEISGGVVKATSNAKYSSAIGGAEFGNVEHIRITGGRVEATANGAEAAGIGSGGDEYSTPSNVPNPEVTKVTITDGTIVAKGGTNAPGIGSAGWTKPMVYISGGSVNASSSGSNADAIGQSANAKISGASQFRGVFAVSEAEADIQPKKQILTSTNPNTKVNLTLKDSAGNEYTKYGKDHIYTDGSGNIYLYLPDGVTAEILESVVDKEAPTGSISIDDKTYASINTESAQKIVHLHSNTVTVKAQDEGGIASVEYAEAGSVYNESNIKAKIPSWTKATVNPDGDGYKAVFDRKSDGRAIYVRLTDEAGNETYLSTPLITNDNTPPGITDVSLTGKDSGSVELGFTVTDNRSKSCNYAYVVLPGGEAAPASLAAIKEKVTSNNGKIGAGTGAITGTVSGLEAGKTYKLYVAADDGMEDLSGNLNANTAEVKTVSVTLPLESVVDKKAPTGSISIDGVSYESVNKDSASKTVHLHSNTVTIKAQDEGGIASVEYAEVGNVYDESKIKGISSWTKASVNSDGDGYKAVFERNSNERAIYVRLTDEAGNVTYLSTPIITNDDTSPGITGVSLTGKDSGSVELGFTITDNRSESCNYAYVVLPGGEAAPASLAAIKEKVTSNNGKIGAGTGAITGTVSGLEAGKTYKLYVAADDGMKDLSGNLNANTAEVKTVSVTLPKAVLTVDAANSPVFAGTYGETISAMTYQSGGSVMCGKTQVAGSWKLEGNSGKEQKPSAGTYNNYTAVFTPTDTEQYASLSGQKARVIVAQRSLDSQDIQIRVDDQDYTGSPIEPVVTVTDSGAAITEEDYTITYANNTNVGTAEVTITGKNNYTGSKTGKFKINALKGATSNKILAVTAGDVGKTLPFDMQDITANTVKKDLLKDATYSITSSSETIATLTKDNNQLNIAVKDSLDNPEDQVVTITITSAFYETMEATLTLKFTPKTKISLSGIKEPKNTVYTGEPIGVSGVPVWETADGSNKTAEVTTYVKYKGTTVSGTDYPESDTAPTEAGEYEVRVYIAVNDNYIEDMTWSRNYRILQEEIDVSAAVWNGNQSVVYDKNKHTVSLDMSNVIAADKLDVKLFENEATNAGDYTAVAEISVKDEYKNNYKLVKESTVGNYRWTIHKADYNMSNVKWDYTNSFVYDGKEHEVKVTGCPDGVTPEYSGTTKASGVGKYNAYVTFKVSDSNYNVPEALDGCAWEIVEDESQVKKTYNMSNVQWNYNSVMPFVYDGNTHSVSIKEDTLPAGVEISEYTGKREAYEPGIYEVTVHFTTTNEAYETPDSMTLFWEIIENGSEIIKQEYDMSGVRWSYNSEMPFVYNGEPYRVSVQEDTLPEGVTVLEYTGIQEAIELGVYEVTVYFTNTNEAYKTPDPMQLSWQIVDGSGIIKQDYDMSLVTWNYDAENPFIYNGTPYRVEIIGLPEGLEILEYALNQEAIEAGEYTVVVSFINTNPYYYNDPEPVLLTWRIVDNGIPVIGTLPEVGTIQNVDGVNYKVITASADSKTVEYTGPADKNITSAVVPAEVLIGTESTSEVYKVTDVSSGAFSGCGKLKTVTIVDGITTIGANAFKNCKALTKITIPNSVTSVGANAFSGCKKLTTVKTGNGVTSIANGTFNGCTKLKTVTLGSNITKIGDKAFYKCTSLTKITIPKKVTSIGKQAFFGCKKLKTITIKSKVLKKVGSKAIKGIHKKANIKCPTKKLAASYKKKLFKSKTGYVKTMKIK